LASVLSLRNKLAMPSFCLFFLPDTSKHTTIHLKPCELYISIECAVLFPVPWLVYIHILFSNKSEINFTVKVFLIFSKLLSFFLWLFPYNFTFYSIRMPVFMSVIHQTMPAMMAEIWLCVIFLFKTSLSVHPWILKELTWCLNRPLCTSHSLLALLVFFVLFIFLF
jgi:hypothetical protein